MGRYHISYYFQVWSSEKVYKIPHLGNLTLQKKCLVLEAINNLGGFNNHSKTKLMGTSSE